MALENDDLLVVQKSGGGELRKVKISDVKGGSLWTGRFRQALSDDAD